ncbi:MAG: hypothetical protein HC819_10975 [Cyclobacteriaceae bacterium]|nr:hypothetical protein [Cyclobacteriaceae bacterium]
MKKYLFLVPLVLILALAYCRYTYVLNPNWSGEESMLRIKQRGLLADPALVALSMTVTVKSIIIYWHMFLLANAAFFLCVFPKGKVKLLLILTCLSAP